jgi:endonuclease G
VSLENHQLPFRPLRGGIEIYTARVDEVGTLGFLAEKPDGGPEQWLVSCYHVLVGGTNTPPVDGESVLQPSAGEAPVAFVDASRADPFLDCAAAKLAPTVRGVNEVLGIGQLRSSPIIPVVGMVVIKSGVTTGVTEGVIAQVNGDDVVIGVPPLFDREYRLSRRGDSGALWLRRDDLAPVALHLGEIGDPQKHVRARSILPVLQALRIRFIQPATPIMGG